MQQFLKFQHCYHHAPTVKPEAATAVVELLVMDMRTPETCWAVNKRQDNKLEKLLHLVGDLFELNTEIPLCNDVLVSSLRGI